MNTPVSVILATRNRPQGAAACVASILSGRYPHFDLIAVDQSENAETAAALAEFHRDTRFRLVRSPGKGLSAARNLGCRNATGEWLLFTDDDCEADVHWIEGFLDACRSDARIGVAFGSVATPDYDRSTGLIPGYNAPELRIISGIRNKAQVEGIGACMAVKRGVWEQLGGFDERLGVNGEFCSGEDTDIAIRALLAGYSAVETSGAAVIHHGFRGWEEAPGLIRDYMHGLGAVHAKLLRIAGTAAIRPTLALGWRWAAGKPVVDLNHCPPRQARLSAFWSGFRAGMRCTLDGRGRFSG